MKSITKILTIVAVVFFPAVGSAAGGGADLDHFTPERTDRTLQRGARIFMNYCMGCHSADYHRYSHMARDIGLSDEAVLENLIFTTDENGERTKIGSLMANSMSAEYGKEAFGVVPPNLALVARSRGVDWLYTYMRSFYLDESRPFGANNTVFPQVGMPHVLADLQGWRKPIYETDEHGYEKLAGFQQVTAGALTEDEYDATITDLVSFLDYLGDPNREARHSLGIKVMLFLFIFLILAVMLKREYWKDVPH
jgi:ubiquinol-cytochrome c reductase cytochrome c1 subunit